MGSAGFCPALRNQGAAGARKKKHTIVCIASGPSLTQEDCEKAYQAHEVIAVNDSWRLLSDKGRGAHLYAADAKWWHQHWAHIDFAGTCWSCDQGWDGKWHKFPEIEYLQVKTQTAGLSSTPGVLHGGCPAFSGYQAVNLALLLGATRILLLGYDCKGSPGRLHFFGDHPKGLNNPVPEQWAATFRAMRPWDHGLEIINCTRDTAIDAFPRVPLEAIL